MTRDSETMPGPIRFTRILIWAQASATIAWSVLQIGTILQISSLSEDELSSQLGIASHADIPYGAVWTQAIVLFLAGSALALGALRFPGRSRRVRALCLAAEVPLILLAGLNLPALNCVVLLGGLGVAAFVMLLRADGRDWFDV